MRLRPVSIVFFSLALSLACSRADAAEVDDAIAWLYHTASGQVIRASERTMNNGVAAFPPQVGIGYEAFWLRDYAYMLEGRSDVFTDQELLDAYGTFLGAQRYDGACVDCVKFDGAPVYMPGYGSMGDNPVADGSQFTVDVAWHTYERTQNATIVNATNMNKLENAMAAVPRSASGLVYIDPNVAWDRCPYGFTDTVRKQGSVLFSSLLYVQAARQMADLYEAQGNATARADWTAEAEAVSQAIRNTFWNSSNSLFHAATAQCNQPDIWGSAFAVYLGVADSAQTQAVANYFKANYGGLVQKGQLRHTRPGEYWEAAGAQDQYQNGGYWATPVGWFVYTLDKVDPALADQTIVDMVDDFRDRGIHEWVNGDTTRMVNYCASAALPLDAILKIRDLPAAPPESTLTLVEQGGSYEPDNVALASSGAQAFARDQYGGIHTVAHLNDGAFGNENSWIGVNPSPTLDEGFVGIRLGGVYQVNSIAFGRDNGGESTEYTDRWHGEYVLQYTTAASPNAYTPDSDWIDIGCVEYLVPGEGDFSEPWLRHRYTFDPVTATGLRLIVPAVYSQSGSGATCIDEFEIYGSGAPGDANFDGNVDEADAAVLAEFWGQGGADWSMGDFNGDGRVGLEDAAILAANWGFSFGECETVAGAPEPGAAVFLWGLLCGLAATPRGIGLGSVKGDRRRP